jgi:hypothetical protein
VEACVNVGLGSGVENAHNVKFGVDDAIRSEAGQTVRPLVHVDIARPPRTAPLSVSCG